MLARWTGAVAQIESYHCSHRILNIKVFRLNEHENWLTLTCGACDFLCFEPNWSNQSITFSRVDSADGAVYHVSDARAKLFIRAGIFEAAEHRAKHANQDT